MCNPICAWRLAAPGPTNAFPLECPGTAARCSRRTTDVPGGFRLRQSTAMAMVNPEVLCVHPPPPPHLPIHLKHVNEGTARARTHESLHQASYARVVILYNRWARLLCRQPGRAACFVFHRATRDSSMVRPRVPTLHSCSKNTGPRLFVTQNITRRTNEPLGSCSCPDSRATPPPP